jgi:hypothetical protein
VVESTCGSVDTGGFNNIELFTVPSNPGSVANFPRIGGRNEEEYPSHLNIPGGLAELAIGRHSHAFDILGSETKISFSCAVCARARSDVAELVQGRVYGRLEYKRHGRSSK